MGGFVTKIGTTGESVSSILSLYTFEIGTSFSS